MTDCTYLEALHEIIALAEAQHWAGQAQAVFRGMDDAVAHRMDRLRASGNGQVPTVAKLAWETLIRG